jgi:hypothetical protein
LSTSPGANISPSTELALLGAKNSRPALQHFMVSRSQPEWRRSEGHDYGVCKLEGLWPDSRKWTLLIRTPDFIIRRHIDAAIQKLLRKGKTVPVQAVRLLPLREGWCVQALHVGPYCDEPATLAKMAECAVQAGMEFSGTLHEIYLSDPRRVAPEKLRTILRQPLRDN